MFYCSLSQEVSTLIATIIGGAIGGICTFLGSAWAMSKQIKSQNKNEKNKILLDYYNLLSKYYNLINNADEGNMNNIINLVKEYQYELSKNGHFVYYIRQKWLAKEEKLFLENVQVVLNNLYKTKSEIKLAILQHFQNMQGEVMKQVKGV